jgi:hypothetical protein
VLSDVGYYFYGVVPAGTDVAGLRGLDDVEVESVEHGGLAAVVSVLTLERPPGRSQELVAHARVVDALAQVTEIVPAQFGSALDHDVTEVAGFLDEEGDRFRAVLERLWGKVQLNLRATYESDQVLTELVQQDPGVAELRRRTRDLPAGVPHPDLVRLGEAVSRALTRKRTEDAETLLDIVLPRVSDHVVRQGGEYDVLERPRNSAGRTALGVAGLVFIGTLWAAAAADHIAVLFRLSLEGVLVGFQVLLIVGPVVAFVLTKRICLGLQSKDRDIVQHGWETGRIVRLPGGEYVEVHAGGGEQERWRLPVGHTSEVAAVSPGEAPHPGGTGRETARKVNS